MFSQYHRNKALSIARSFFVQIESLSHVVIASGDSGVAMTTESRMDQSDPKMF